MADKSAIEWTEATWNPIAGCTAVSPGCDHCYAARDASGRLAHLPLYAGLAKAGAFTGEVRLVPERLDQPLRWRRPRRVFVNSMSDLFHDGVPDEFITEVFARMWWAPEHTFQVLTKRHGRMRSLVPRIEPLLRELEHDLALVDCPTPLTWPLPNVWLGVSLEDQQWADIRVPALLDTPAAVRWLSCEPLLGPLDLTWCDGINALERDWIGGPGGGSGAPHPFVDWVVVGGESGPGARPMHPDWARSLRDQCVEAGVPFFFKQWGEWCDRDQLHPDVWQRIDAAVNLGQEHHPQPMRVGKKRAGRLFDGRTWDEYPTVVSL